MKSAKVTTKAARSVKPMTAGKATKAVGLTKAKYGKSMMKSGGKCKSGC